MPWLLEDSTTLSERLISSWARQRLVAASSRRTDEKVASRKGSGRHWRSASRARALSLNLGQMLVTEDKSFVIWESCSPKETANNMFQQPYCLLLHKLGHHVTEHSSYSIKSFVGMAYISKSCVV